MHAARRPPHAGLPLLLLLIVAAAPPAFAADPDLDALREEMAAFGARIDQMTGVAPSEEGLSERTFRELDDDAMALLRDVLDEIPAWNTQEMLARLEPTAPSPRAQDDTPCAEDPSQCQCLRLTAACVRPERDTQGSALRWEENTRGTLLSLRIAQATSDFICKVGPKDELFVISAIGCAVSLVFAIPAEVLEWQLGENEACKQTDLMIASTGQTNKRTDRELTTLQQSVTAAAEDVINVSTRQLEESLEECARLASLPLDENLNRIAALLDAFGRKSQAAGIGRIPQWWDSFRRGQQYQAAGEWLKAYRQYCLAYKMLTKRG